MIRHGRNCIILINGTDISGDLNEINPVSEQEMADVTTFGKVGHTSYPGMAKDSLTIQALYNNTEAGVFEGMIQDVTGLGMMIAYGSILGDPAYCANEVMLKGNSIKSVVTDVNRATINFDVDNYPFVPCTMLTAGIQSVGVASTGDGATVDFSSDAATTGGAAYLQVTSVVAGTLTVKVETSTTGLFAGEEATSATFAAASSSEFQRVAISGTFGRCARATWVSTISTAAFALALNR